MDRSDDLRAITDALTIVAKVQYSRRARRQIEHRAGVPLAPIAIETLGAINSLGPVRHGTVARRLGTQPRGSARKSAPSWMPGTCRRPSTRTTVGPSYSSPRPSDARPSRTTCEPAQETLAEVLSQWSDADVATLAPLLRRLAEEFAANPVRRPGQENSAVKST